MSRLSTARILLTVLRAGNARARLRATRDGQAAVRLNTGAAAVRTGVLDALAGGPAATSELARRLGTPEEDLLAAFLRVLESVGLVRAEDGGRWSLTAGGRAVADDDLVRASHEAFAGFHTGLYRELEPLLAGGPRRRDVVEHGGVIARVSTAFEPFVDDVLRETVAAVAPRRVLDVGCGAGLQLATMLATAPRAEGVGVDADADAADLARRTLADRGLAGRSQVLRGDVRDLVGGAEAPFDLVLLANVVYYVPVGERVALLRSLAELIAPGGTLLVVTTVATPQLTSRHFDLLLRAQEGATELPHTDVLVGQLVQAGLEPAAPRRIAPGMPLVAVAVVRPG
ncbi:methyltransferase domain-containing protein [Geodermatophilus chilensis]|uniref:methyltransferase domain-containing protein n=1 Tax=Geodermatophilus chilensis TaxID=2035835 RepID=UPI000C267F2D|nr:methyltransferase domain-containing protein [Geodermatophilus chilensis]